MALKFERFKNTGFKYGNYSISVSRSFGFGFNSGFYHKDSIKSYKFACLSYDKQNEAIAFLFTNNANEDGAFKISHGNSSAAIVARSFFNAYAIDVNKYAGKYDPKIYNDSTVGKMYYINLQEKKSDM